MNKQSRIVIVGSGSIGEIHLRCLKATGRATLAISEINDALRADVARRYGISESYSTIDQALQSPWDVAVIATPAHLHVPIALRFAEGGTALLIEKPLSTSLQAVDELMGKIKAGGVFTAIAYVYRAHPALAAMRQAITGGRFGMPLQIVVSSGQHFPLYRPTYSQTYYRDWATGGGAIQDALTHLFNAGEWILGPIDRVTADAAHQNLPGVEVEDTVVALVRHGTVLGCYSLNQYQSPNESVITVVCEQGTARWEIHNHRWHWMTVPSSELH